MHKARHHPPAGARLSRTGSTNPPVGSTAAQLKADIDSGATGDKVGGFDPSAAPLATDEEAGGVRIGPLLVGRARAAERESKGESATANAATPELQPDGRLKSRANWIAPALVGAAAAFVLGVIFYWLLRG
jgi:hypothetical protein